MAGVGSHDALDDTADFFFGQGRPTPDGVPAQHQFEHDRWIDPMPEHMAGQRSNPTVALAFIDTSLNETAPVSQRVTGCPGVLSHRCQPSRSIGEPHLIRSAVCPP
ncbi:hypothetical protein FRZ44_19400 [Hypericibacter terrae]|jgi:hypothetical protein|uniref:Uncharacterized protein n=1 Tax=Hypericibacter terrae TaxID=2602015 RepID=A0A5J6MJH7_9PROT|nr:hypothetical protein FRZ44_19400 [Hypericibacter terrae]